MDDWVTREKAQVSVVRRGVDAERLTYGGSNLVGRLVTSVIDEPGDVDDDNLLFGQIIRDNKLTVVVDYVRAEKKTVYFRSRRDGR